MTLDQLRYFQAVCSCGSVSRAAEYLNISQPSVSSAISNLEKEFGVLLFSRQNKKMTLTKEGAVLLEQADLLIADADRAVKVMNELGDNRVLNLGVPPMLSSLILPIILGNFCKIHPDFKINVTEGDRSTLIRLLDENKINMAFLPHQAPVDDEYRSLPFAELNNVCCVSKNHPLAKKASVTVEELKSEPLVLFKNSFFQTERILERFKQNSVVPRVLLDSSQVSTVQSIVSEGIAVGFIFEFLLKSSPELVGIPLSPPMRTQISLVWKQGKHLSGNMNHFIEFISDCSPKN
ncbi:MAG: LysR family transcriptional regulator [Clostridia bacterium]|nr:LysR family transcriptional regulator [Clostridia bacterium]